MAQEQSEEELWSRLTAFARKEFRQQQAQTRERFQALSAFQKWQSLDLVCRQNLQDHASTAAVPSQKELLDRLRNARPYVDVRTPAIHAQLRVSRVPFRYGNEKLPRIDVVQVKTSALFRTHGVFTRFLERLTVVANRDLGRIVMIESVIGPKLLEYIQKRPYDFYLVPYSENNFVYLPSVKALSPDVYRSLLTEAEDGFIRKARRRQGGGRQRFGFYSF
ncbi:hypothetical protein EBZ80_05275 [bacterium]|nr:hypothetical protein [bacterium]